jgi:hypothetical protein
VLLDLSWWFSSLLLLLLACRYFSRRSTQKLLFDRQ